MPSARHTIIIAGIVLIGAGFLAILRQALTASPNPALEGDVLGRWVAGVEFPGLIMIFAGAILLCVAVILRS
jgi:hypothetical protein